MMANQAAPAQLAARRPCRLVLLEDAGGPRYFLDGRAVHAGDLLEVLLHSGEFFQVRFEWSGRYGVRPSFCFSVPDRQEHHRASRALPAHVTLPEGALFRRYEP